MKSHYHPRKIAEHSGILAFEDGLIINQDGSVAVGYKLSLPQEEQLGKDGLTSLIDQFSVALKNLPTDTAIQKIDIYTPSGFQVEIPDKINFFHRKSLEYQKNKEVIQHQSFLYISFFNKNYVPTNTPLNKPLRAVLPFLEIFQNKYYRRPTKEAVVEKVNIYCSELESAIPHEIEIKRLTDEENDILVHQYLGLRFNEKPEGLSSYITNLGRTSMVGLDFLENVNVTGQSEKTNYFFKNNFGAKGVTASFLWPVSHFARFPHMVCQTIRIIDDKKFLKGKFREFYFSSVFKLGKRNMDLAFHQEGTHMDLEREIQDKGHKITFFNLNVFTWGPEENIVKRNANHIRSQLEVIGFKASVGHIGTMDFFFANIPGNAGKLWSGCPMPIDTACANFIWEAPRKGDIEGIILNDRHGNPILYNTFNYKLPNQHAFVFGPTGSGKSFFNGKLIKDRFFNGDTVIVVDSGGTYRRLFEILGGAYIEYKPDKPLKLNPFLIPKTKNNRYNLDTDQIVFLTEFIAKIWKEDAQLSKTERVLLSDFLIDYYNDLSENQIPSLTHFYIWFQGYIDGLAKPIDHKLFSVNNFLVSLKPYALGHYAEHFNATTIEDFDNCHLICFEIEAVRNNKELYPIVMHVLFDYIFRIVEKQPNQKKFIDIEEGWAMLNDASTEYIEAFFRKGRKTNTSIRIVTQSTDEVKFSSIAGAMRNNASTIILLYNEKESIRNEIAEFLGLSEFDCEKYASLRQTESYREVFIKQMNDSFVCRLDVSLFEHGILTSRPDERNRITDLAYKKQDLEAAVAEWVQEMIAKKIAA